MSAAEQTKATIAAMASETEMSERTVMGLAVKLGRHSCGLWLASVGSTPVRAYDSSVEAEEAISRKLRTARRAA